MDRKRRRQQLAAEIAARLEERGEPADLPPAPEPLGSDDHRDDGAPAVEGSEPAAKLGRAASVAPLAIDREFLSEEIDQALARGDLQLAAALNERLAEIVARQQRAAAQRVASAARRRDEPGAQRRAAGRPQWMCVRFPRRRPAVV